MCECASDRIGACVINKPAFAWLDSYLHGESVGGLRWLLSMWLPEIAQSAKLRFQS